MGRPTVFVVSADSAVSDSVKDLLESAGLPAETFTSLQAFLNVTGSERRGCLVLDLHFDDLKDPAMQSRLTAAFARMPGILIIDRGDVSTAVRVVKAGAMDVVQKPGREPAGNYQACVAGRCSSARLITPDTT